MDELLRDVPPPLNENLSCGVVTELWASDWCCWFEPMHDNTMALTYRFVTDDATTLNVFRQPVRANAPTHTFSWQSPGGVIHQGALFINGAVYEQVDPDTGAVSHFLLVEHDTAIAKDYPEGWVRLKELEREIPGDHPQGNAD